MIDFLLNSISKVIELSETDNEIFRDNCKLINIKKNQHFLKEGEVSHFLGFVVNGCLKTYSINKNGIENIYQFSIEGWWINDMYSYLTGEPATYNIQALEDCEIIILDNKSRETIFEKVPKFEKYMRILLEKNYIASQMRLNSMLGNQAEERYLSFIKTYPQIVQRVPQHSIASYLGITPETLSRVRSSLSKQK